MAHSLLLFLLVLLATRVMAQTLDLSAEQARSLPDQAQVRVLGRVTSVGAGSRSFRIEADGMRFTAEVSGVLPVQPLRVGDRVFVAGVLRPEDRILIQTLQRVPAQADRPVVGALVSVDNRGRRLTLRTDVGLTREVGYGAETTFVRLGRRSRVEELVVGDRLWIDVAASGPGSGRATRVEVIGGVTPEFSEVGEITQIDRTRRELRVRFGSQVRLVDASRAVVRSGGGEIPFTGLEIGTQVRVSGVEREGTLVARAVVLAAAERPERTVAGRVRSVDAQARVIRLVIDSLLSVTMSVRVPESVSVQSEGRTVALRSLRPGDRIRVRGRNDLDGQMVATRVERVP